MIVDIRLGEDDIKGVKCVRRGCPCCTEVGVINALDVIMSNIGKVFWYICLKQ